jgi:hypothetical protein
MLIAKATRYFPVQTLIVVSVLLNWCDSFKVFRVQQKFNWPINIVICWWDSAGHIKETSQPVHMGLTMSSGLRALFYYTGYEELMPDSMTTSLTDSKALWRKTEI